METRKPVIQALCHVFKYPSNDVCGLFVGMKTNPDIISECIPLFHSNCVTVPIMRTSMSFIDNIDDRVVVAIYCASTDGSRIPPCMEWLQSQVEKTTARKVPIFRFDREKFEKSLSPFDSPSHGETLRNENLVLNSADMDVVKGIFINRNHITEMNDFEDHLNDPRKEWLHCS